MSAIERSPPRLEPYKPRLQFNHVPSLSTTGPPECNGWRKIALPLNKLSLRGFPLSTGAFRRQLLVSVLLFIWKRVVAVWGSDRGIWQERWRRWSGVETWAESHPRGVKFRERTSAGRGGAWRDGGEMQAEIVQRKKSRGKLSDWLLIVAGNKRQEGCLPTPKLQRRLQRTARPHLKKNSEWIKTVSYTHNHSSLTGGFHQLHKVLSPFRSWTGTQTNAHNLSLLLIQISQKKKRHIYNLKLTTASFVIQRNTNGLGVRKLLSTTANNMTSNALYVERISPGFYQEENEWSSEQVYQNWTHSPLSNSTKDLFLLWR